MKHAFLFAAVLSALPVFAQERAKVIKQLRDKKGDNAPKALQALLKDGGNSKVGARAQLLLTALQTTRKD